MKKLLLITLLISCFLPAIGMEGPEEPKVSEFTITKPITIITSDSKKIEFSPYELQQLNSQMLNDLLGEFGDPDEDIPFEGIDAETFDLIKQLINTDNIDSILKPHNNNTITNLISALHFLNAQELLKNVCKWSIDHTDFSTFDGTNLYSNIINNELACYPLEQAMRRKLGYKFSKEIKCSQHTDQVGEVKFSPDGSRFASCSTDNTVCLWDSTDGHLIKQCSEHTTRVWGVTFSPDGSCFVSWSSDDTICLWDSTNGNLIKQCSNHTGEVRGIKFSPDGSSFASWADDDKTICLWNKTNGNLIKQCSNHTGEVRGIKFSPDGSRLASWASDNTMYLWNSTNGNLIKQCSNHTGEVWGVTFSPDGSCFVSWSSDDTICLWDSTNGNLIKQCSNHTGEVRGIKFSPDGSSFASWADDDKTICLWNKTNGNLIKQCSKHTGEVWHVAFSPDGSRFASHSEDNTVCLWDGTDGHLIEQCSEHTGLVQKTTFSPDGSSFTSWSDDNEVNGVAFSPDGSRFASWAADNIVYLWDSADGRLIKQFSKHTGTIWNVRFSPDGSSFASYSNDKTVRLYKNLCQNDSLEMRHLLLLLKLAQSDFYVGMKLESEKLRQIYDELPYAIKVSFDAYNKTLPAGKALCHTMLAIKKLTKT